jgi:hypothetical protein
LAKIYCPNTCNGFNGASPGMMFVEMTACIGDMKYYYISSKLSENLILPPAEKRSVLTVLAAMGI